MNRLAALVVFVLLAAGAHAAPPASELEKRAEALRGYWFSDSGTADRRYVLNVTNVLSVRGNDARLVAKWGPALRSWSDTRAASARLAAENVVLEMETAGGFKISLSADGTGALAGHAMRPEGKPAALRLVRATLPQIHEWLAANPLPEVRAAPGSAIELVYLSAADCGPCRGWERDHLERGAPKAALGWDGLRFSRVERGSFRAPVPAADFPEPLREPVAQYLKSRGWSYFQGTPQWVLFVNGKVRAYAWGSGSFNTLIHPAIKAALAEAKG